MVRRDGTQFALVHPGRFRWSGREAEAATAGKNADGRNPEVRQHSNQLEGREEGHCSRQKKKKKRIEARSLTKREPSELVIEKEGVILTFV